jgi:hypothetical protein
VIHIEDREDAGRILFAIATMSASAATEVKQLKAKKAKKETNEALFDVDSLDVIIPTSLLAEPTGGECSMLVQIDPRDAALLDFEGAQGAIGRFEAEDTGGERRLMGLFGD